MGWPGWLRVLDGGFATELERAGWVLGGPLWSARLLREAPEAVRAVHRAYLEAGADCLLTGSYQASWIGYARAGGLGEQEARAEAGWALRRGVELAREAVAAWRTETGAERAVWVAASLGPYGAALANGAEFTGEYGVGWGKLVAFHRERVAALEGSGCDVLAFETVPSLEEAEAIAEVLRERAGVGAWVSFTCRDGEHVAHGEPLALCARLLDGEEQVVAVGVNCTAPELVEELIGRARAGTGKAVVVYPNSGERWDAGGRCWVGERRVEGYAEQARAWYAAGAQAVGGCCRTGPEHVAAVRGVVDELRLAQAGG